MNVYLILIQEPVSTVKHIITVTLAYKKMHCNSVTFKYLLMRSDVVQRVLHTFSTAGYGYIQAAPFLHFSRFSFVPISDILLGFKSA